MALFSTLRAVPASQAPWSWQTPSRSTSRVPSRSLFQPLPCPSSNTFGCLPWAPQKHLQPVRAVKLVKEKHTYWHLLFARHCFLICHWLPCLSPDLKAGAMSDGTCKAWCLTGCPALSEARECWALESGPAGSHFQLHHLRTAALSIS